MSWPCLLHLLTLRDGMDGYYTNGARIISLITQGIEVLQKFALPGHTMVPDADLRS